MHVSLAAIAYSNFKPVQGTYSSCIVPCRVLEIEFVNNISDLLDANQLSIQLYNYIYI
jgi:hypothetical protein